MLNSILFSAKKQQIITDIRTNVNYNEMFKLAT